MCVLSPPPPPPPPKHTHKSSSLESGSMWDKLFASPRLHSLKMQSTILKVHSPYGTFKMTKEARTVLSVLLSCTNWSEPSPATSVPRYSEIPLLRPPKIKTSCLLKTLFAKFKLSFSSFSTPRVHLIRDHLWDCPKVVLKTTFGQSQRWSWYRNFTVFHHYEEWIYLADFPPFLQRYFSWFSHIFFLLEYTPIEKRDKKCL